MEDSYEKKAAAFLYGRPPVKTEPGLVPAAAEEEAESSECPEQCGGRLGNGADDDVFDQSPVPLATENNLHIIRSIPSEGIRGDHSPVDHARKGYRGSRRPRIERVIELGATGRGGGRCPETISSSVFESLYLPIGSCQNTEINVCIIDCGILTSVADTHTEPVTCVCRSREHVIKRDRETAVGQNGCGVRPRRPVVTRSGPKTKPPLSSCAKGITREVTPSGIRGVATLRDSVRTYTRGLR